MIPLSLHWPHAPLSPHPHPCLRILYSLLAHNQHPFIVYHPPLTTLRFLHAFFDGLFLVNRNPQFFQFCCICVNENRACGIRPSELVIRPRGEVEALPPALISIPALCLQMACVVTRLLPRSAAHRLSSLAPQFVTHRFGNPAAAHTLELYLDLICPFSMKQVQRFLLLHTPRADESLLFPARRGSRARPPAPSVQLRGRRQAPDHPSSDSSAVAQVLSTADRRVEADPTAAPRRWSTKLLSLHRVLRSGRARSSPTAIPRSSASSRSTFSRSWMGRR